MYSHALNYVICQNILQFGRTLAIGEREGGWEGLWAKNLGFVCPQVNKPAAINRPDNQLIGLTCQSIGLTS